MKTTGISLITLFAGCSDIKMLFRKLQGKFGKKPKLTPYEQRSVATLPKEGENISVELALNSRCISDYDGKQGVFHWGIFDQDKRLPDDFPGELNEKLNKNPIFEHANANVIQKQNVFTFITNKENSSYDNDLSMVWSGFQQQLLALTCAARGVGIVFSNMGPNGQDIGENLWGNIKMIISPMKPSYGKSYWSQDPPGPERNWIKGNLPDPVRNGKMPLFKAVSKINISNPDGRKLNGQSDTGQLLWAARGRTPHLYLSKSWGMTIPSYQGEQAITHITLHDKSGDYTYSNWYNGRPTNRLEKIEIPSTIIAKNLGEQYYPYKTFIIIHKNEDSGRASWETGYQLCNVILQAIALNLDYKVITDSKRIQGIVSHQQLKGSPTVCIAL